MTNFQETPAKHNIVQFPDVLLTRIGTIENAVEAFDRSMAAVRPAVPQIINAVERFQQPVATEMPTDVNSPAAAVDPEAPLDLDTIRRNIEEIRNAA